mmetsp:Transcript_19221/g.35150  ORF Transcript_19221/g.35150 Transcript_19221/m.35150 type:complete len:1032 (+) Transcript_19221:5159-8254(+)
MSSPKAAAKSSHSDENSVEVTATNRSPKAKTFDVDIVEKVLKEDENKVYVATAKADFELAERHQQARVVRDLESFKEDQAGNERCVCCNYPTNAPTFDLWTDTYLLKQLGPGFPLYYRFVIFIWFMTAVIFIIAGLACWAYNLQSDNSDDWDAESDSYTIKSSLGNNGDPDDRDDVFPLWQFILHLIAMATILIFYHFFWTRKQRALQEDVDRDMATPSDYTVYVTNLGKQFTVEEVKEFFTQHGKADGEPANVLKVNITYDISEFVELSREMETLKNRLKYIDSYKADHDGKAPTKGGCCKKGVDETEAIRKRTEVVYNRLQELEKELKPGVGKDLLIGQAFVTFKTQIDARLVRYKWDGEWQDRFWNLIFRCCRSKKLPLFKGRKIRVKRAPEPNDIFWENLSFGFGKRLGNTIVTSLFTLVLLGICFVLIYATSAGQESIHDAYGDDPSSEDLIKIRVLSILPSFGVVFINMMLGQLIRRTSAYEKHHTLTSYHTSVAVKLTIATCVNTALIALIVNLNPEDSWFTPGGLATDMTYILLSNAFLQPISYVFSPMYLVRLCKRRSARKNPYCTQAEANMIFEGPPVDMAQRYANVMKTFIVTCAFAALIPLGVLFSLFGLILSYWVDKILLLRRHARPSRLSGKLSETMSLFVPWAVLIYAIMTYVWMEALNPDQSAVSFVWMLIVLGYFFLPIETFLKCRKADLGSYGKESDYQEAALTFVDDYDRENPVTSDEGWAWYFDLLHKKKLIKDEDLSKLKDEMLTKMGDVKNYVSSYATSNVGLQYYHMQSSAPSYIQNMPPSAHQKIKSAIIMNSGPQNYYTSYNAPGAFSPFNPIFSHHVQGVVASHSQNAGNLFQLPAYVPPQKEKTESEEECLSEHDLEEPSVESEAKAQHPSIHEYPEPPSKSEESEGTDKKSQSKYPSLQEPDESSRSMRGSPPPPPLAPQYPQYSQYPVAPQYVQPATDPYARFSQPQPYNPQYPQANPSYPVQPQQAYSLPQQPPPPPPPQYQQYPQYPTYPSQPQYPSYPQ